MITDEELGLVVAENEIEKRWIEIKEQAEKDIENLEKMIWFQRQILSLARENLNGTKKEME